MNELVGLRKIRSRNTGGAGGSKTADLVRSSAIPTLYCDNRAGQTPSSEWAMVDKVAALISIVSTLFSMDYPWQKPHEVQHPGLYWVLSLESTLDHLTMDDLDGIHRCLNRNILLPVHK